MNPGEQAALFRVIASARWRSACCARACTPIVGGAASAGLFFWWPSRTSGVGPILRLLRYNRREWRRELTRDKSRQLACRRSFNTPPLWEGSMRSYADLRSGVFCQPVGAKRRCIAELKHNRRWPVVAGQRPRLPVQNLPPHRKRSQSCLVCGHYPSQACSPAVWTRQAQSVAIP